MLGWRLQHFTNALFRVCSGTSSCVSMRSRMEWRRPYARYAPAANRGNAGFSGARIQCFGQRRMASKARVRPNAISAVRRRHPVPPASRTLAYQADHSCADNPAGWEASLEFPSRCCPANGLHNVTVEGLKRQLRGGTLPETMSSTAPAMRLCARSCGGNNVLGTSVVER